MTNVFFIPELPEVETIRRGLEKYLVGKNIIDIEVRDPKLSHGLLQGHEYHRFGDKVVSVRRFGKGLVIDLKNNYSITIHIKMTGQLIFRENEKNDLSNKHTRVIFKLDDDTNLYFNDIRRFGWIKIVKTSEVKNLPFFKQLGPEPFRDFTLKYFQSIVKKNNSPIKSLLMDQSKISGLGNIYANDTLNLARINPLKKSSNLNPKEISILYKSIHDVLKKGLKFGGASQTNYVDASGQKGNYQKHFLVYDREGEKCFNCRGIIKKIKLAGRGTYFCLNCQY